MAVFLKREWVVVSRTNSNFREMGNCPDTVAAEGSQLSRDMFSRSRTLCANSIWIADFKAFFLESNPGIA
jgi:hypothetical protein